MTRSLVIEVDSTSVENAQASINTALTAASIPAEDFLFALTVKYEAKNQTAQIVVFYDGE
jgi:hypothetical protein